MSDLGTPPNERKLGYRFLVGGVAVTPWMSFRPVGVNVEEWIDGTETVRRALSNPFFEFAPNAVIDEAQAAKQVTLELKEYIWDAVTCQTTESGVTTSSVYVVSSKPTPIDEHRLQKTPAQILDNEILWTRPRYVYMNRNSVMRAYYYGSKSVTVRSFDKFGVQIDSQTFGGNPNKLNSCPIGMKYLAVTAGKNVDRVDVIRDGKTWTYFVKDCDIPAYGEIYFLSRMGGWDTLPFAEVKAVTGGREFTEVRKGVSFGSSADDYRLKGGRTAANVKPLEFITLTRPGAESEKEAEWLKDFMTAGAHYVRIESESGVLDAAKFVIVSGSVNVWETIEVTGYFSFDGRHLRESD